MPVYTNHSTNKRTVLLIFGMHRSGTSAFAGLLKESGIPMGSQLMPPAFDNPRGFYENEYEIVCQEVKKGDYWIFSERTMHGSGPNTSNKTRPALNARLTNSDTLIYPGRLKGEYIDGSNLDISKHECVLLSGTNKESRNVYGTTTLQEMAS